MMSHVETEGGLQIVHYSSFSDFRGNLLKLYRRDMFLESLPTIEEVYFSTSKKAVVRGLHYQLGVRGQDKFIHCISGRMIDVSVDMRPDGELGRVHVQELVGGDEKALLVPAAFAHGVVILEDDTTYVNISPQPYSPGDERGIRFDSLNVSFPIDDPIVSEKDMKWPSLYETLDRLAQR